MTTYPKTILTIEDQIAFFKSANITIDDDLYAKDKLKEISFYRLRGYYAHIYDNNTKTVTSNLTFKELIRIYEFDNKLSDIIFKILKKIEVSLRSRIVDSLLLEYSDALILTDPTAFKDKNNYWKNNSSISSEIARSKDYFIKHNYDEHDGLIPLWAVVEVISYGTLSKIIGNLKHNAGKLISFRDYYKKTKSDGTQFTPSYDMISSWIQSTTVLRNICAHGGRLYNRVINNNPLILAEDIPVISGFTYKKLYNFILVMKYLSPNVEIWKEFYKELVDLTTQYSEINLSTMNFPSTWLNDLNIY